MIDDPASRRSGTLAAATILVAGEGILWLVGIVAANLALQSICTQFALTGCPQLDAVVLFVVALPGVVLIAIAFPLWRRLRWAWTVALSVQALVALAVAVGVLSPLLAATPAGRGPSQFAADLAVAVALSLLQLLVFEIPQIVIVALLLSASARRGLRPVLASKSG